MFSFFRNGIKQTTPNKIIDLPSLVKQIKHNPQKDLIEKIRTLRKLQDQSYKILKEQLSYITPSCLLKTRKLETTVFNDNFISFSGYLYYDIDDDSNVNELKDKIIRAYHDVISLVSISSSAGGILILVKISNTISSSSEYNIIWEQVRCTVFQNEKIDIKSKGLNHPMFISYDPEVFVNYENETNIDTSACFETKGLSQPILYHINNIASTETLLLMQYEETLRKVKTRTEVQIDKLNLDYKKVKYVEIKFPNDIKDNSKHKVFTGIIHALVYLNPDIHFNYLYSYLYYVNNRFAKPKMRTEKLNNLFVFVYNSIINNNNYSYLKERNKYIHFSKNSQFLGREKKLIACKLNGKIKQNSSIEKILKAKEDLTREGIQITQKSIVTKSGLSLSTVKRYYKSDEAIDIYELVDNYNNPNLNKKLNDIYEDQCNNRENDE